MVWWVDKSTRHGTGQGTHGGAARRKHFRRDPRKEALSFDHTEITRWITYRSDKHEVLLWTGKSTHDGTGKRKGFLLGSCKEALSFDHTETTQWITYRSDKHEVLLWTDPRTHDGNGKWKSFLHGSCPRKQALTITTTDIWGETALWFDKMSKSAILGMRMLTDGYVSRQEFDDMIHEHRAQYKIWSYSHTSDW